MMMAKATPRTPRRHPDGHDQLVISLPDPRVLRLVARSVLLAAALLSLPWIRALLSPPVAEHDPVATGSRWIDDPFFLPMLLRDLQRHGLLKPDGCAVFIGDASSRLPILRRNGVEPVAERRKAWIPDRSVDFVLAGDGFGDASFAFIDRVLRIGGVTAARLGSDPSESFHLPVNYRMAYIRRFGSTVVAIKKVAPAPAPVPVNATSSDPIVDCGGPAAARRGGRRLLAVPAARRASLERLEGAMLEPGSPAAAPPTRYLPELIEDSLESYPRRVFVDVKLNGSHGSDEWFEKEYPKKGLGFEIVSVEAVEGAGNAGVAEWLSRSVREEDYVVMKAEAEVAEEILAGGSAALVDELFVDCVEDGRSRRAYWECVALYGRLLDEGVAVHQWWG